MESSVHSAYQEELQQLEETLGEIDRQLEELRKIPPYTGEDHTEQVLESIRESRRRNLAVARNEPYFGRLDFQEQGQNEPSPLYIGKVGVEKESSLDLMVIDWRAPVASLFYSFTGGTDAVAYDSPEGTVEGLVYLKRNLVIRKQILQRVVDTYDRSGDQMAVTDEFLLYRLGENKDNKLRDIVSTIQAEQDAIIRAVKNSALIIQGVAGSGKTTVALHRLAFLLYQYRDQVRAERMIILAPNRMFLDYISGVLPELGVGHIQQTTFTDWALELLEHEVKLADQAERLTYWFQVGDHRPPMDDTAPGRIKGSLSFMKWLDRVLQQYEAHAVPRTDFVPWDGARLPHSAILKWYDVENKHEPLMKRRERVLARMKRWLEMELEKVWEVHLKKDYKKKGSQRLREYSKHWTAYTPFSFYKELFQTDGKSGFMTKELQSELTEELRADTEAYLKKKRVQPEDLAPLLYIRAKFAGIHGDLTFDHTVIDEAQDFSPFQVALLQLHTRNQSFTILGDLSQGIHAYQGITDWNEFSSLFEESKTSYFQLNRSYRSTMEIIYFANEVLTRGWKQTPALAVPVFRSGDTVRIVHRDGPRLVPELIREIQRLQTGDVSTVAVLGRTEARCKELHKQLSAAGMEANFISAGQQRYAGGISVVPSFMAKGLEFDAVIIVDADSENYQATPQDAKLLYVGCTRALHSLQLWYSGEPSPLIADIQGEFVVQG
ncbi:HelD family protein [Paenibacillus sp. OAS669]|uniref:HelD family protein n=1 Tax=Paenibacillus sp. OAS669 TaxID=2663821 RepID=UPI001789ACCD|nr:UvrD-helicase domain-containing protein [Paenibacillus sp. OAS669]MBE1441907.1 DNA helicase-2/ATP-dependent DNA helicase PcrA [Paenibacillus sp. OAS669]